MSDLRNEPGDAPNFTESTITSYPATRTEVGRTRGTTQVEAGNDMKVDREGQQGGEDSGNEVGVEGGPTGTGCILLGDLHERFEGGHMIADW